MKKDKLLELIKYIKENELIEKYNDVYKEYDEKKEIENPGFRLQDLYSLTDEEVDKIISSKHDIEALFRLRMNSVNYNSLIGFDVNCNDIDVLDVIEKFRIKKDYNEYDINKRIIRYIIKQDKNGIEKIYLFLSNMVQKKELSETNLKLDDLFFYLTCVSESKTYKAANFIGFLASSSKNRSNYGMTSMANDQEYSLKVIDKISMCTENFQVDYIGELLRTVVNIPYCNPVLLNNVDLKDKRLKILELFTKTKNEEACKRMIEIIKDSAKILNVRSNYVINMLEECSTLENNEEYVDITSINEIDDLEELLVNMTNCSEIDVFSKVKVKKKKSL